MDNKYSINLNEKFGALKLIDAEAFANQVTDDWFNQTLCQINDCVVRIGVFKKGEFHWHKHDKEDEFFFVLKGTFIIELEKERISLNRLLTKTGFSWNPSPRCCYRL
jgi:oxalate decarboxylase/phosphoglucose isomerase-like protein (cupin superfamily)